MAGRTLAADISYERYVFPGWWTSLAAIFAGMVISFVLFGLFYPFWWFSDQDLILAYQGLLLNAGLPQEYFDHTGYLYALMIAGWYDLLHWVGLLPVHALTEMPPPTDVPAFDAAWQHLVVAGRVLSLLAAGFFVWLYASLVRRLVGDWRVAVLAALALALSSAVIMHMRMMRTELLSGGLAVVALLAHPSRRAGSAPSVPEAGAARHRCPAGDAGDRHQGPGHPAGGDPAGDRAFLRRKKRR